jgi:hypothetical protein
VEAYVSAAVEGIAALDLDGGGDVVGVRDVFVDLLGMDDSE